MRTIFLTEQTRLTTDIAATIGFFDGVHLGHRYLVEQLRADAADRGLQTMVVTFDRHPRQVLHADWQPLLLTTLHEKEALLRQTGIDILAVLPFDEKMAALSARRFMQQVLKEQLGVRLLLTGYDNHFGHRDNSTDEGFTDYVRYGSEMGIDVVLGQPLFVDGVAVNSSLVRRSLCEGRVEEAQRLLGRTYCISGTVVYGRQRGRQMGFPTANLLPDEGRLVPANGVYAVRATIEDEEQKRQGMTNIGRRPTFDGHQTTIETHIFDYDGNLYGQHLTIDFVSRLRQERQFESPDALAEQMDHDAEAARRMLSMSHEQ